jgi:DNA-binding transcriptional ArsR family regulator
MLVSENLRFVAAYQTVALEALADPTRRSIFELLGSGGRSVVDITRDVPISRPAVSQHLKVLRNARLVTVRPIGTRRIYSLDPTGLAEIRRYFEQFWNHALADFARAAEAPIKEEQ